MAVLTVTDVTPVTGVVQTLTAAAGGGDSFPNADGRTYFVVTNGGGSSITVTINSVTPCDQGADHDGGGAVANGTTRTFGPFQPRRFNNASGAIDVTYSGVTSVTVGAFRLPPTG
jgi:hypothetical protein